jgi:predicted glycoside hydrolase/deacetylase ChbG (UPF0249 family)
MQPSNQTRQITICADDFGYNPAISQAIYYLVEHKKINAFNCLTNTNHWEHDAGLINDLDRSWTDVGLHLNLTEGKPFTRAKGMAYQRKFIGSSALWFKCFTRQIDSSEIYQEFKEQIEKFMHLTQSKPDFIDGHHHIHQFPIIRQVLLELYHAYDLNRHGTYIRSTANPVGQKDTKPQWVKMMGAKKLQWLLWRNSIPYNQAFSGSYYFNAKHQYADVITNALASIPDGGLIMCHPGMSQTIYQDKLATNRLHEYHYLQSDRFDKALETHQIKLVKGSDFLSHFVSVHN